MKFRISNLFYFFRLAFQGIVRNSLMSAATVFVLTSALLVSGSTWLLSENLNYNLQEINTYNKVVVFVSKSTDDYTTRLLKEKIEKLDSVESVQWVTKDEVLENLFEDYGDYGDILQMYDDDNPLKDELVITYSDSSKVNDIAYQIRNMNEQDDTLGAVDKINDRREVAEKIDEIKNIASLVSSWLLILLLVVSVFIVMNTIRLAVASRSEEIFIMRCVGASGFFVSFPFLLQGMLLATFSAVIAYLLQYYIYSVFVMDVLGGSGLITIIPFMDFAKVLAIAFPAIAAFLAIIGSWFSLRKYNKD